MSYVVKIIPVKYMPSWFRNAWSSVRHHYDRGDVLSRDRRINAWNKTYNNVITVGENPEYVWTVTFPTEQDYTWFLLKWS